MNHWTSQQVAQGGYSMPSFEQHEDRNVPFFEDSFEGFDDGYEPGGTADMTLGEFYGMLQEAQERMQTEGQDADILPFIPALLGAVPSIVSGVSSMVQSFSRPRSAPPAPRAPMPVPRVASPPRPPLPRISPSPRPSYRPPLPPTPRPAAQVLPQPMPQSSPVAAPPPIPQGLPMAAPPPSPANDTGTMATLLALLANPAFQQSLQTAAGSSSIPIGSTDIPVSAAIDIIGQLAGALSGTEAPPTQEHYPDFLFDSFGNALVDPDSVEDAANLLLQRLQ